MGQILARAFKVAAHWWTGHGELLRILLAHPGSSPAWGAARSAGAASATQGSTLGSARVAPESQVGSCATAGGAAGGVLSPGRGAGHGEDIGEGPLAWAVAQYLRRSRALASEASRLFGASYRNRGSWGARGTARLGTGPPGCAPTLALESCSVAELHASVARKKGLPLAEVQGGPRAWSPAGYPEASLLLRRCLGAAAYAQGVASRCVALRAEAVDRGEVQRGYLEPRYSEALESVWETLTSHGPSLKPGEEEPPVIVRGGDVTAAWGEVGFQGKDPCTDFRGGGFLSLLQLRFVCVSRPSEARAALALCEDPGCYLPFAATAINFSAWSCDLVQRGALDRQLLSLFMGHSSAAAAALLQASSLAEAPAAARFTAMDEAAETACNTNLEAAGLDLAHGLFADLLLRFLEDVWRPQRPSRESGLGAMGFPRLFKAFQDHETARLLEHTAP